MSEAVLDRTFTALGDPARRRLLTRLAAGAATAGDLARPFDISRPAISRHLRVLREAGLVTATSRGRQHWYALHPDALAEADRWLDEVQTMWSQALQSLKDYIEKEDDENAIRE